MAVPGTYDLEIYRGDDFERPIFLREKEVPGPGPYIDLTGWSGRAMYKAKVGDTTPVISFTVTILNQGSFLGGLTISLTKAQTAALTTFKGVWDLELTDDDGNTTTYLKGDVEVNKDVTV